MKKTICEKGNCSGCGACSIVCPVKCIKMEEADVFGTIRPNINTDECVGCGLCRKTCHIIADSNNEITYNTPCVCYAARSSDLHTRTKSASGGVASEIYSYAIDNGYLISGACFNRDKGVCFRELKTKVDIEWARDSKYVFSDPSRVFDLYINALKNNNKSIFIGLPCQVAALITLCKAKKIDVTQLITVEIICHGVPNFRMLDDHLNYIEKRRRKKIDEIHFRTPNSYYNLTCFSNGKVIWKRGMHENDTFYRGFSIGLFFRDSCYNCHYAKNERVADITIGDYSGLGSLYPFEGNGSQMSVVFCNTYKGISFFDKLCKESNLERYERPKEEALNAPGNEQLRHPSKYPSQREAFVSSYEKNRDFELAAKESMHELFMDYYKHFPIILPLKIASAIIPKKVKKILKRALGKI